MAGYNASVTTLKEQLEAVEKRLSKHEPTLELPDTSRTAELDLHAEDQLRESESKINARGPTTKAQRTKRRAWTSGK